MPLKNLVIINDFNYIQGGASKIAIETAKIFKDIGIKVYFFSAVNKEEEKIVVIRQFRVPINSYIYEMPAGLIDKGENPLISLTRELKEETGLDVIEILENTVKGQLFLSPGMTDESVTSAFCTCSGTISKGYMEEDEDIEPILLSQKEVQELLEKDVKFDIKCYIYLNQFAMLGKKMFE